MELSEDIKSFIVDLLVEGIETKNMRLAKHYLYSHMGYDEGSALKVIGGIKSDIPNSRLGKCKFMLALVRMYCDGELKDYNVIDDINKTLKYAASDAHINEYNNDLNGLSAIDLISRFSGIVSSDLENDRRDLSSVSYSRNNSYDIVKINSFSESEEYGDYVNWCVTYDKNMYNAYTKGWNGVFYFCLRDGFENEERVEGEGCPLDSYGLSMIAVSVNGDGSCNTITCRWNHDNNGNDSIMTTKELSRLLGVNFYDVFKPLSPKEIEDNKKEMLYEIEEELSAYIGYETPDDAGCDKKDYYPEYGDEIDTDVYAYLTDSCDGVVLIDNNWNLLSDEIFDRIGNREGDVLTVNRGNDMNFLKINGDLLSVEWFDQVINEFKFGVGLCRKGKLWNAIRKDGSYVFDEWFTAIDLHGRYNRFSYFMLLKDNLFMYSDLNGNYLLNRWFEKIFKVNDYNTFIRFAGDNYYTLVDTNTYKIKSDCKVGKLKGWFKLKFYLVELLDGTEAVMTENGNIYDLNSKRLLFKVY